MMGPLEFVKDRTIFFSLVLAYHGWKETYGEGQWRHLTSKYSDFDIFLYGVLAATFVVYTTLSLFFGLVDYLEVRGGPYRGERLQPKKYHTWELYKKAIPPVLFNFAFMAYPSVYVVIYFLHPGSSYNTDTPSGLYPALPSTTVLVRDILVGIVIRDMVFYYLHRLFHHPLFYGPFHKKHHEFNAPVAVSALYANPIDFVVTNVWPLLVAPLLLNYHPVTSYMYVAEAIIETVSTHSGYNFPGFPSADMHDFHHETFNSMFSLYGIGDWVHGTDKKFNRRMARKERAE